MAALTAIVVALAIGVAANFLFLLAIVRRLRLQRPAPPVFDLPSVGMQAPPFSAHDANGNAIDESFYVEHGDAVIAFFSDNCEPCQQAKAELARNPLQVPLLAFIHTGDGSAMQAEFARELTRSGVRAVLLAPGSDLHKRFAVSAFPTLLRLRDGIVVASSIRLDDIRNPTGDGTGPVRQRFFARSANQNSDSNRLVKQ